ncbi:MAG: HEPN domain-containing protein [Prevotella sp.]|nr:HEPN domain-containing protein [Prevotella sp.]
MSTENRAKYWLDVAEEDMSLAEYIFKGGHWLYTAFMCHQAIEMIPMNIEARYPDYKRNVANSLNEKAAKDILDKTKQLLKWIRQQFPETKTNKTES